MADEQLASTSVIVAVAVNELRPIEVAYADTPAQNAAIDAKLASPAATHPRPTHRPMGMRKNARQRLLTGKSPLRTVASEELPQAA